MKNLIKNLLRRQILNWKTPSLTYGASLSLVNIHNIHLGAHTKLDRFVRINATSTGKVEIGEHCEINDGVILRAFTTGIKLGNHCSLNPYVVIYGEGGVTIGNDCRIAAHTVIVAQNHVTNDLNVPIRQQGLNAIGISIEDDVWIGANVTVVDGAIIRKGAVIAAGAVVRGEIPAHSIAGGIPAKVIKMRNGQKYEPLK